MANREEQRKKLREVTCDNTTYSLTPNSLPPGRPKKDCEVKIAPAAEKFLSPDACPVTLSPTTVIPTPLTLTNDEVTESCPNTAPKNGPLGSDSTINADQYSLLFHFTSISDITANQLTFISTISSGERDELADAATSVARIVEITGLSTAQATELKNGVAAVQTAVQALADSAAYAGLFCYWQNAEQTASCGGTALTNAQKGSVPSEQAARINNDSVVAAGTYISTVSQLDADTVASNAATAALGCIYGNVETTRACTDIGFTEAIADTDDTADTLDGQKRKGSATVAALTTFSASSQASANAAAQALADAELNCFYPNEETTWTCADEGVVAGVAGDTGPVNGDAVTGLPGQSITVPAGFLTSKVSTSDANAQALAYAQGLIECWICNDEQVRTCPDQNYTDTQGNPQTQAADETVSDPYTVTVAKCTIKSTVGVDNTDANTRAQQLGDTQLGCRYCNDQINSSCVPAGYSTFPADVDDYDRSTWSRDATRGVAADTFCCAGAGAAQNCYEIATGVATLPIDNQVNGADCRYGNDETEGTCETGAYITGHTDPIPTADTDKLGTLAIVEADTFFVAESAAAPGKTAKETANDLAIDFANAISFCYYTNTIQNASCPNSGDCAYTPSNSNLSDSVAAGSFISLSSQAEADSIALAVATSKLVCLCCNEAKTGIDCAVDEINFNTGTVDECSFVTSGTTTDANTLAQSVANGMNVCITRAAFAQAAGDAGVGAGADGAPGNDGAQTNCTGTCIGYYAP